MAAGLAAAGLPLAVVNPRQIRAFAQALGLKAKTDALDAAAIARFAEAVRPEPRPVADAEAAALGELVARRRQLVETMTAERNRRRRLTNPRLIKSVDRVLALLQQELTRSGAGHRRRGARLSGVAGDCRAAHLGARRRQGNRPHADRRTARTRPAQPARDRCLGRARAI